MLNGKAAIKDYVALAYWVDQPHSKTSENVIAACLERISE